MKELDFKYADNKPLEMNETDYFPLNYRGDKIADSRVEAWEFIVGGGAGFNQLSGLYTVENPSGKTPENEQLWLGLKNLQAFMSSLDYAKMAPDKDSVRSGAPQGAYMRAISEPGKQYAMYIHHSGDRSRGSYEVTPGTYQERLSLNLKPGKYRAEWVNPALGTVVESKEINHRTEPCELNTPTYSIDLALRMKRLGP